MSLRRVLQFLARFFQLRQAPNDLFERPLEPRVRQGVKLLACPRCGREFPVGMSFDHDCTGKAA